MQIYKLHFAYIQIDPRELHGQSITLGDKSKIKIKNQRYCAVTQNARRNVTCVFNAGKEASQYKIGNFSLLTNKLKWKTSVYIHALPNLNIFFIYSKYQTYRLAYGKKEVIRSAEDRPDIFE